MVTASEAKFDADFASKIKHRQAIFDTHYAKQKARVAELAAQNTKPISVTLPNGSSREAQAYVDSPLSIASAISKSLANECIIAKVDGQLWEIEKPLESSCSLELLKFDHPEAQKVFWHSSAHILGEALEEIFGSYLCYGPPIENGFYYDAFMKDLVVNNSDYPKIEAAIKKIIKEKQPFESLELSKADLKEMFNYSKFKCEILDTKVKTDSTTVYRCGSLIDLCPGPHVRHTGIIKALKVLSSSSSNWLGDTKRESLQRVYGVSFPSQKMLDEHLHLIEEQKKRNHMKIGLTQHLWQFSAENSPGSCFFEPKGAVIYSRLCEMLRKQYRRRGFNEVITPNIYKLQLWDKSGHLEHYEKNMFVIPNGEEDTSLERYALKPMNCPGHCLMFGSRYRTYKELPMRLAEFGICHRNEASGALTGLTRVVRFQQDDAHIFCEMSQIESEINGCIDFLRYVYNILGFEFSLELSTRPEKFLGDIEVWNKAEAELEKSLNLNFGEGKWKVNPGDGAFYGPKIDVHVRDALKKSHQLATIQLDFNLPERFGLQYATGEETKKRPVIIHRAIFGSMERSIAVLAEHYGGRWPLWMSPSQVCLLPVSLKHESYVDELLSRINSDTDYEWSLEKYTAEGSTLNYRIRQAQLSQFNFICVVGDHEMSTQTLNVRTRNGTVHADIPVDRFISTVQQMIKSYETDSDSNFGKLVKPAAADGGDVDIGRVNVSEGN